MKLHHIGYAVKSIEKSEKAFKALGYETEGKTVDDLRRNVRIKFITLEDNVVELIEPMNEKSPVCNLLKKNGAIPYHLCYEVENIADKITELKKNGFILISGIGPAPAIDGYPVAFMYGAEIGVIELLSKK